MGEETARTGLPMFFKRVMMGDQPVFYGGAGYLDYGLPERLGPFLDQLTGTPLPMADIDNPFVNQLGDDLAG